VDFGGPAQGEQLNITFFGRTQVGKTSLVSMLKQSKTLAFASINDVAIPEETEDLNFLSSGLALMVERALKTADIAVIVIEPYGGMSNFENQIIKTCKSSSVPIIICINKSDMLKGDWSPKTPYSNKIFVSATTGKGLEELQEEILAIFGSMANSKKIIGDLISPSDLVLHVPSVKKFASHQSSLIPRQQMLKEAIEADAYSLIVKQSQLKRAFSELARAPRLVITDSEIFENVAGLVPADVPLTSYDILNSGYKGLLEISIESLPTISKISSDDKIFIENGCVSHQQCDGTGEDKIASLIQRFTNTEPKFEYGTGNEFPSDLSQYSLILHCDSCLISEKETLFRREEAISSKVPLISYSVLKAYFNGTLTRALSVFPTLRTQFSFEKIAL
jgi:[FeFe] hydrogenase H-cluster maturation GTPase HydF